MRKPGSQEKKILDRFSGSPGFLIKTGAEDG
jgi:hypothetical protein